MSQQQVTKHSLSLKCIYTPFCQIIDLVLIKVNIAIKYLLNITHVRFDVSLGFLMHYLALFILKVGCRGESWEIFALEIQSVVP